MDINRVQLPIVTRQLYIEVRVMPEFNNKIWVRVRPRISVCSNCGAWDGFRPWVPAFQDLYHIVKEIADCEEIRYPQEQGFRGRTMVFDFLKDCLTTNATFGELRAKYQIPNREAE